MARRRVGKSKGSRSMPRAFDPKESKMRRWKKPSDIPLDEEDQFHASRDTFLLEDKGMGDDDDGDEDEVFALKGVSVDSDEDEDSDEDKDAAEEDRYDDATDDVGIQVPQKKKSKSKKKKGMASSSSSEAESESEEEGWGNKKSAYYSSNAAQLESDDEEANELEEQEAKRLQAKARDAMEEDDFGLVDAIHDAVEPDDLVLEAPAVVAQPPPQDKQSLLRHLEKTCPETVALARDWEDATQNLVKTQRRLAELEDGTPDLLTRGMTHLYYQGSLTYCTSLAFYLYLAASEKYAQRPELLRAHPILPRLLMLKQSLTTLEGLEAPLSDSEDKGEESHTTSEEELAEAYEQLRSMFTPEEQEYILREAKRRRDKRNARQKAAALAEQKAKPEQPETAVREEPPRKKKRKTGSASKPVVPVFDLVEPDFTSKAPSTRRIDDPIAVAADVYGEATALQGADAADKKAQQKSLRFHTARIESTSARRQSARSNALGGDDDIPYRERKKQREERLAREAAKTRGTGGDDLDDAEPESRSASKKRGRGSDDESSESGGDDDGYYELVQRKSKADKEKKKAEYDMAKLAARHDLDDSADGPRGLTRAILKNKGLTPHRGKSVRNPRVKKRQKYEQAKKKLASQKAIYKGGLAQTGRYEGEKSGVSRIVKSVRL